ncbi:nach [Carabus blaptoides fortunei]
MLVKKREKKENRFIKTCRDFGAHTSFHGVKYIVSKDNTIYEKILWAIVVLLCIAGSVYMTMIFWNRFNSNPIRITIQSMHKHTSIIPFPGITICPAVRQIPEKVDELLADLVLPVNVSREDIRAVMPMLMGYNQYRELDIKAIDLLSSVFRLNGYNAADVFKRIEPSCSEIILKCRWEHQYVPCEKLFKTSYTRDGHCCTFNGNSGRKNFTLYRTLYYGVQMGLSVILNPLITNVSTQVSTLNSAGVKILIHSPEDYPGLFSIEKILAAGRESFIRILGTKLISSSDVESLTAKQRSCLIANEMKLKYFNEYRDTNCGTECKMDKVYHYCDCIPYYFPPSDKLMCNISSIACLSKNYNRIFRSSTSSNSHTRNATSTLECECPPQCNDVFYAVQTSNVPMADVPYTTSDFYKSEQVKHITDMMVVHMYFGSHYQTVMIRDTITSTYYLLSSFGGVFSLFLGCSFVSILEIIYYFCIRIFTKY